MKFKKQTKNILKYVGSLLFASMGAEFMIVNEGYIEAVLFVLGIFLYILGDEVISL